MTIRDLDPDEYADCFALARDLRPILESRFSPSIMGACRNVPARAR